MGLERELLYGHRGIGFSSIKVPIFKSTAFLKGKILQKMFSEKNLVASLMEKFLTLQYSVSMAPDHTFISVPMSNESVFTNAGSGNASPPFPTTSNGVLRTR